MPACQLCGEENSEQARFCQGCGQALAGSCPKCGEEIQASARFCPGCGESLAGARAEEALPEAATPETERKVVTVVFSDVTGSTAMGERLDPESVRNIMARYFERMRAILESHGGTVEKFIGDAVMAVFGIPVVHEDDPLRAVRAVDEIRRQAAVLSQDLEARLGISVRFRTGVNTGEVIAGDPSAGEAFATGDTVNVAARLEQAAEPGEILLGDLTHRLVRHAVVVEAVEPLTLKGKAETVPAWRLVALRADTSGLDRSFECPIVGRDRELEAMREAFGRCVAERRCELVSIVGEAGMGKSRLTDEFLGWVAARARVLQGRCLSYGQGITFWPIQEALKQAAGIADDDPAEVARERVDALLPPGDEGRLVAQRVHQVLGLSEAPAPTQEIFWGIRKLLEALAASQPLVVVLDDLHWAEPALLDLVEYLLGWTTGASILLIAPARAELFEKRPSWGGLANSTPIVLEPLSEAECERLIEAILGRIPDKARRCVVEAAEGNPFFAQEMLRLLVEDGLLRKEGDEWAEAEDLSRRAIPPTIGALLAARLDRLEGDDRGVLQRASVAGKVFWWGAVCDLLPQARPTDVGGRLQTLVRKEFIRPHASTFPGEDAFSFAQILVHDAAYQATAKETRARLHERFAGWLERKVSGRVAEFDEILGYHLEKAYRYRVELGVLDEHIRGLSERAAAHLGAAGRRALDREDARAAVNLLARAAELWRDDDPGRVEILRDLGLALFRTGAAERADTILVQATERARRVTADPALEHRALVTLWWVRLFTSPDGSFDPARKVAEEAIAFFEGRPDKAGLTEAFTLLAYVHTWRAEEGASEEALRCALAAQEPGGRGEARVLGMLPWVCAGGPRPVTEALALCDEIMTRAEAHPTARCDVLGVRAWLEAARGQFDEARRLLREAEVALRDLGRPLGIVVPHLQVWGTVEMAAGEPTKAEEFFHQEVTARQKAGNLSMLASAAAQHAHALLALGRDEDAEAAAALSQASAASDDLASQAASRSAQARVAARRGAGGRAEKLARKAVSLAQQTDSFLLQADALAHLAEVLRVAGRTAAADEVAQEAVSLYERKGHVPSARRLRKALGLIDDQALADETPAPPGPKTLPHTGDLQPAFQEDQAAVLQEEQLAVIGLPGDQVARKAPPLEGTSEAGPDTPETKDEGKSGKKKAVQKSEMKPGRKHAKGKGKGNKK